MKSNHTPSSPQLGFGASGAWGARWFTEGAASAVIDQALKSGIRHFDTAGFYTGGLSEARLGRALAPFMAQHGRKTLTLSTKVGKEIGKRGRLIRDYRPESIRAQLTRSMAALGTQMVDIVYLHGPNKHELSSALPSLTQAKDDGLIKAIGICTDTPHLMQAACHPDVDVVMGRYNLFHQDSTAAFCAAKEKGKTVVAIAPLAQALWRRDLFFPKRPADIWYLARAVFKNWPEVKSAQRAKWLYEIDGWSPASLALSFVRMNTDIDIVMTTSTKPSHIEETTNIFTRSIPADVVAKLKA